MFSLIMGSLESFGLDFFIIYVACVKFCEQKTNWCADAEHLVVQLNSLAFNPI